VRVDLVLSGHRHVPYVWPIAGMLLVHSGTVSTLRTRGFPNPAYNLIHVEAGRISVDLCVPRGERQSLGDYPRDWPPELSARHADPFVAPNAESRWRRMRRQHPGRDAGRRRNDRRSRRRSGTNGRRRAICRSTSRASASRKCSPSIEIQLDERRMRPKR
jgi:hypothetical protein